ncbi:MAG: MEDS domain-containing protein, partial [Syntrophobacteraceae bacterium]
MTNELRKTGIEIIGDVPWGTHFCHFYETKQDLFDILIPYFKNGLENNEFCVWVIFPPHSADETREILRRGIPDIDQRLAAGDMEILPHEQWYLKGGSFNIQGVIDGWREKLTQALARGYAGMRVNGNEAWLTQENWKDFSEYEEKLSDVIANQRMIVLCTYLLALLRGTEVFDVISEHEFAIARRYGKWEVIESPELKQTKDELKKMNEDLEQRVLDRTSQLAAANEEMRKEIAERKRVDKALQDSEGELRTLFAAMMDVVLVLDSEGRYVKIAPTNPLNLYRPVEELLGKKIHEVLPKEDADKILHQIQRALESHQTINFEYKLNIGSREVWFDSTVSPLTENSVFWIARDITERKRATGEQEKLEAQLFQAQKMESVGRLAGGVAHDFNNMLSVIIGRAEMAIDQVGKRGPLYEDLQEIINAGRRSADLTRQLLAFARKQTAVQEILDSNDTISSMLKMLRRLIGEDIDLFWQPGLDLWKVKIDPSQVDQILANLVVNARDAISGVGAITMKTENVLIDDSIRAVTPEFLHGDYVLLSVSDTGAGMSKEVRDNIFEPFFTTKEVGKGTGLGLSTVYGIVKQNDGFIYVASELGKGTTFKIYLPRFEAETAQVPSEEADGKRPTGTETIL